MEFIWGEKKNNLDEVNTQNFPPFSSINKNLITIIYPLSKFIKKRDQEHLRRYLQHQAVGFHILKPATLRAVYTMYKSLGNKGRHTKHDDELLNKCLSVSKFSSAASILQNLQNNAFSLMKSFRVFLYFPYFISTSFISPLAKLKITETENCRSSY